MQPTGSRRLMPSANLTLSVIILVICHVTAQTNGRTSRLNRMPAYFGKRTSIDESSLDFKHDNDAQPLDQSDGTITNQDDFYLQNLLPQLGVKRDAPNSQGDVGTWGGFLTPKGEEEMKSWDTIYSDNEMHVNDDIPIIHFNEDSQKFVESQSQPEGHNDETRDMARRKVLDLLQYNDRSLRDPVQQQGQTGDGDDSPLLGGGDLKPDSTVLGHKTKRAFQKDSSDNHIRKLVDEMEEIDKFRFLMAAIETAVRQLEKDFHGQLSHLPIGDLSSNRRRRLERISAWQKRQYSNAVSRMPAYYGK